MRPEVSIVRSRCVHLMIGFSQEAQAISSFAQKYMPNDSIRTIQAETPLRCVP